MDELLLNGFNEKGNDMLFKVDQIHSLLIKLPWH